MPKLALSMIVRDAASTLDACLKSAAGVVDEIVIADTGSNDSTPEIARSYGARVLQIPWENDFASARNQALAAVTAHWVLSLDADERLDPESARVIPTLLGAPPVAGYLVTIRNYVLSLEDRIWDRPATPNTSQWADAQSFPAYVEHENVRLFRRDARIQFVGRVHESVGPSIENSGLGLAHAPFLIHHFGLAADRETRARKNVFYRELGLQKILDMPDNPQAYLELGIVELDNFGNVSEALRHFERACELNPRLGVAWFFAGLAHSRLGVYRQAIRCLKTAQKQGHVTSFVAETIGDAHYNLGEFPQSVRAYKQAIQADRDSPLVESKLGLAILRAGGVEAGLEKILDAVRRQPEQPELHDRLILSFVWLERLAEAAAAAEDKLRRVRAPRPEDFRRAAGLWASLGEWKRSAAVLHVGSVIYPNNEVLKQALAELSANAGANVVEVIEKLTEAVQLSVSS
jgi:glycosyltransferase involved in cell wall biosynthesis